MVNYIQESEILSNRFTRFNGQTPMFLAPHNGQLPAKKNRSIGDHLIQSYLPYTYPRNWMLRLRLDPD